MQVRRQLRIFLILKKNRIVVIILSKAKTVKKINAIKCFTQACDFPEEIKHI